MGHVGEVLIVLEPVLSSAPVQTRQPDPEPDEQPQAPVRELAARLAVPVYAARGERGSQVGAGDFAARKQALDSRPEVAFELYPSLNHRPVPGADPTTPADVLAPGHVHPKIIDTLAAWIGGVSGGRR